MSNFIVPNTFVPGTKAKAQEVNENFVSVQDELNQKAEKTGSASQVFFVADAQNSLHAINKGQFENAISELAENFNDLISCIGTPFVVERAYINSSGNSAFMTYSGGNLVFRINSNYSSYGPLVAVPANNLPRFTVTSVSNLNLSSYANGTYNIFLNKDGVAYAYNNTIYTQKAAPSSPVVNDIFVNTSCSPLTAKIYQNSSWVDFNDVYLGYVKVSGNEITSVKCVNLNDNGLNVNRKNQHVVVTTYKKNASWYRVWSDGWIEQGGKTANGTNQTITLLKSFTDTNYCILTSQYYTSSSNGDYGTVKEKTESNFTIPGYATMSYGWYTCGY